MNTQRSDNFIEEWTGKVNPLKRASVAFQRTFNTSPEKLFRLLCPTTEYDWIPNWNCELLHSNSGRAEYNAVLRTSFFGPEEIWVCTRYEPNKAIDYSRTSRDLSGKMDISLTDNRDGTVTGKWVMTASALNGDGNTMVAGLESARQHVEELLEALAHYVNTGEMRS